MSEKPPTLDYHGVAGRPRRPLYWHYIFWAAIYAFIYFLFGIAFLVVVPKLKMIFMDFGTTLPLFTLWVIVLGDFMVHGGWLFLLVAPFLLILPLWIVDISVSDVRRARLFRRIYTLVVLVMLLLFLGLLVAVLVWPLLNLIGSLSGP